MTIQFHCSFCTAPIEVDDSAAGKSGRCPVCAARLTVPGAPPGVPPAASVAPQPQVPASEPVVPEFAGIGLPPDLTAPPVLPGALPDPARPSFARHSVARKVQRKARRGGSWLIPGLFVLAFAGVMAWLLLGQVDWTPLSGEVAGTRFDDHDLEALSLNCEGSPFATGQLEELLSGLGHEPVLLSGDLVQAQIRGEGRNLLLSARSGAKTTWYQVDLLSHPGVMKYLAGHVGELEALRTAAVQKARNEFLETLNRVHLDQESTSALSPFRDQLVIPALVQGLGWQVTAQVGNQLYPCIREPREGQLCFLLPEGVTQFEIAGRKQADGSVLFPGHFTVKVAP